VSKFNPSDLSVYAAVLPPPGDLSKPEIELVQSRLREMGYHTVGLVDGRWGDLTTGAIAALQARAGIPVNGRYDDDTMAAMKDDRNRRQVSLERAAVTVSDLRAEGSKTIKAADKVSIGSYLLTGLSALIAFVTFVSGHWDEASQMAGAVRPLLEWVPAWAWPAVVAVVGGFLALKAGTIKQARVDAERTGVHNGDPSAELRSTGAAPAADGA
jgi:peptidoglycan hydrolase-like protein with peptidoglycan-binding domain